MKLKIKFHSKSNDNFIKIKKQVINLPLFIMEIEF